MSTQETDTDTDGSDQPVSYRVNPDHDTPEDCLHAGLMLGKWVRILDQYGNHIWFRSVEHIVRRQWAVYYDTDNDRDTSHLVSRSTVEQKIRQRWPDVELRTDGPPKVTDNE